MCAILHRIPVAAWLAIVLAIICVGARAGEDRDLSGPAASLLKSSAFAHGYLHGYEAGFHIGDFDFHVDHIRDDKDLSELNNASGYRASFGSRERFRSGYREGFRAGYADSTGMRDFRAYAMLEQLSPATTVAQPKVFDEGFQDGYLAGRSRGTADLEADGDFDAVAASCPAEAANHAKHADLSDSYCDGYRRAFRIGYTDSYLTPERQPASEEVASGK